MRLRALPLLVVAVPLLALAWSLAGLRAPLPTGDEATPVTIAQSLWHDHDLVYAEADLRRAERVWDGGPAGLTLFTSDGGKTLRYGRPLAYPLAALPFYGILGLRGIALLNMALFLGMAGAAIWHLSGENALAGLFAGGFFFASAALAYAFRLEPDVFVMACAFFPLLIWQRLRKAPGMDRNHLALLALAGVLLGVLLIQNPLAALLGLPVLADFAWRRRWRDFAAVALAGLLAAGALALLQKGVTGEWTAFGGAQRRTFETAFPLQSPGDPWQGYRGEDPDLNLAAGLRLLPRNLLYVFAGRYTGLLPYLPFALFALALYLLGPKDRARHLLLGTLAAYVLCVLLVHPNDFAGGPGFLGSRYLATVYPAFLFLPGRINVRRSLALALRRRRPVDRRGRDPPSPRRRASLPAAAPGADPAAGRPPSRLLPADLGERPLDRAPAILLRRGEPSQRRLGARRHPLRDDRGLARPAPEARLHRLLPGGGQRADAGQRRGAPARPLRHPGQARRHARRDCPEPPRPGTSASSRPRPASASTASPWRPPPASSPPAPTATMAIRGTSASSSTSRARASSLPQSKI